MHSNTAHQHTASPIKHLTRRAGRAIQSRQYSKPAIRSASKRRAETQYALATGEAGTHRLQVLHDVYGPGTRRLLRDAGLRRGMRVADIGCGPGMVTVLLAEIVGPEGDVVGVDFSGAQIAEARARIKDRAANVKFIEASATETGLPRGSFDLVYCRYLLMHLPDPERALAEMLALLKPNGILVCEDGELTSAGSEPPSALGAFADLWGRLGAERGIDYDLGRRLYQMVLGAGFLAPQIVLNQPVAVAGENKRLLELSVAEAGPTFIEAGLISAEELDFTLAEMRRANEDTSIVAVMPRVTQVWARKPAARPAWFVS